MNLQILYYMHRCGTGTTVVERTEHLIIFIYMWVLVLLRLVLLVFLLSQPSFSFVFWTGVVLSPLPLPPLSPLQFPSLSLSIPSSPSRTTPAAPPPHSYIVTRNANLECRPLLDLLRCLSGYNTVSTAGTLPPSTRSRCRRAYMAISSAEVSTMVQ